MTVEGDRWRRPRPRPDVGVVVLIGLVAANVVIWLLARPQGVSTVRYTGSLCGAEAILCFSCALVLATVLGPIERAFGGLDRVALWHRRTAVLGVILLVPHLVLVWLAPPDPDATALGSWLGIVAIVGIVGLAIWATAPSLAARRWPGPVRRMAEASYEQWLSSHRLMGIFVALAVVHAGIVDPAVRLSRVLLVTFIAIGVIGVAAYLYREIVFPRITPIHDYRVAGTTALDERTLGISLDPVGQPLSFRPGQFIFIAFGGLGAWQRHPFSVSSAPSSPTLELAVRAAGDYTSGLRRELRVGSVAKVAGPYGGFDHSAGGHQQIWIAAGIGITPFLSWIRSLDARFDQEVAFFYAVNDESAELFADEIAGAAAAHPTFHPHLWVSDRAGPLDPATVMTKVPPGSDPWVYMCGPPTMMRSFARGFRTLGVPDDHVRWEQFDIR